jgi:hypothetical protein
MHEKPPTRVAPHLKLQKLWGNKKNCLQGLFDRLKKIFHGNVQASGDFQQ